MIFDIKKRRKELNLTLEQIRDFVGVGKSTVKKWENGAIENMKRDKIALLSEILKVSPLEIMGITVTETSYSELSDEQKQLIKYYNTSNDRGKALIMSTAEYASAFKNE